MNSEKEWLKDYLNRYKKSVFNEEINEKLIALKNEIRNASDSGRKVILIGNGGSAAIASHCAVDLIKNAKIKAISFDNSNFITCLSNDYGFELWMAKALELYANENDIAIFISSSGSSRNILNAVESAKRLKAKIITFSGFKKDNPLGQTGLLNFWVDSLAYNIVENTHQIWLLAVVDLLIGNAEYPAS